MDIFHRGGRPYYLPHRYVWRSAFWAAAILLAGRLAAIAAATDETSPAGLSAPVRTIEPAPIQDDAGLHDVQFVDGNIGWAVGDHGVIWRTNDGGRTWQLLPCPADCALRSACFVNDRVGWIVGGATMPFTRLGVGIVLKTADGGRTWSEQARGRLPQLVSVRFFSPNDGVLVGESTGEFPGGIIATHDGGKTWRAVEGTPHSGWRGGDFRSPEVGVVAGLDGTVARIDGNLLDVRAGGFGPRGLYGVSLAADDTGWVVGDGGIVLRTVNRGVVWESPPTPLPEEAADIFNFRTVAVRGEKLWIAGSPGSVVWHSADGGRTWSTQRTGQTAPLERLFFQTDENGWAAGALGTLLYTQDGGKTWQAARAANRRAALLSLQPRAESVSFAVLAKEAAELGYRSAVVLPFRGADEAAASLPAEFDLRLQDAVTAAGGSHGSIGWQFPLNVPGLNRDPEKLIADWMLRTEGRFKDILFGNLVCQIRTWRPTVIVIDSPSSDDAAGNLLVTAIMEAVRQAADPAAFPAQRDLACLAPWKTTRVFARLPSESHGDVVVATHESLSRLHSTVATVAASASSRLVAFDADLPDSEAFRLLVPPRESEQGMATGGELAGFFRGLEVGPDARRRVPPIDAEFAERSLKLAQRDRNFRAIMKERTRTASHGGELLALMRNSTQGDDRASASLQLATLADAYKRGGQWELAEAALVELVDQYPNEAASLDAMRWLLQYWTGAELTYQRFRVPATQKGRLEFNPAPLEQTIKKAVALAGSDPKSREPIETIEPPDLSRIVTQPGRLRVAGKQDWVEVELKNQRQQALRMAQLIRRKSPSLFRSPEVQLPLASLLRQSGLTALPTEKGLRLPPGSKTEALAENALPLIERPTQKTVKCAATAKRPKLDGLLSDDCWQKAAEIPLWPERAPAVKGAPHAFCLLAHDSRYLYFAISVPRVAGMRKDGAELGRKHDQDLSPFDRVALCFDTDRDFVSWYTIEIDQRGCVAESCWGDPAWNPAMYIARAADAEHWRIEGAIPFSELVAHPPQTGEQWNLAVLRTVPAVRLESWCHPAAVRPRPETFGIVRFQ